MTAALGDIRMHPRNSGSFPRAYRGGYFHERNELCFSANYAPGGVVSSARFGDVGELNSLAMHRTAAQSLCMIIKTLSVLPSTDRACVTRVTRGRSRNSIKRKSSQRRNAEPCGRESRCDQCGVGKNR